MQRTLRLLQYLVYSMALVTMNSSVVFGRTNSTLQAGINAFQESKWDEAKQSFSSLVNDPPWRFAALFNLGNVAVRQKHLGEALAYYHQAVAANPHDRDARFNLKFVADNLSGRATDRHPSFLEIARTEILSRLTFSEFLVIHFVVTVFILQLFLSYLRRRALLKLDDPSAALMPNTSLLIMSFAFVVVTSLTLYKLIDTYTDRAIVTTAKADLRSGPNESNASMTEATEGTELLVQDRSNDWLQVSPASGGLTGWVPANSVILISGWGPW